MTLRIREITDEGVWLKEWRPPNINASEGGALFGIDPYCSPLKLHHIKKGNVTVEDTDAMRRGRWLEPAVIKASRERRPDLTIDPCTNYYDDPALRIGCTPDAFVTDQQGRKGVLQAKTVGKNIWDTWVDENGEVHTPLGYQLQTMIESVLTKRIDFALLSVMIVGYRVDLYGPVEITPEIKTYESFKKRVKKFWSDFEKDIAPPVTPEYDGDLIKDIYSGICGGVIDLRDSNRLPELLDKHAMLAAARSKMNADRKPLDKEYEEVRTEIRAMIGDYETALLPGGLKASLKLQTNKGWTARVLRISEMK